ncbi:uncharacterized protein LOC117106315 [Anneissia japonica]|uniref:uncharacterized protein LOC117106315 n=1 Tax=Anneissia japonica TaxID=1529436 RepID=UPI001425AC27|nr:uncharacterized protein LOC117106315 [Anneissia japonica]
MDTITDQESVRNQWQDVCFKCSVESTLCERWWSVLEANYSEERRHYHTLHHIRKMNEAVSSVASNLKRPDLVYWSVFFHDIIYDPKSSKNEEESAKVFEEFAAECLPEAPTCDITDVSNWILMTRSHITHIHLTPNKFANEDKYYFLDADMEVLGWANPEYDEYANQIRSEYTHVAEKTFRERRSKVLKSFLKLPNIYATKIFRDKYEAQARSNLQREIDRLGES